MIDTKQELLNMVLRFVEALEYPGDGEEAPNLLDDALDVEYTLDAQGRYLGARVLMGYGGPNI